ncbi:VOC family protein [Nitratireductor rhodophyticola]|uniref:VOC family protein n=1 Tax=Nitratireductor rhodophyticola TaxID=2854036 RepID=UPI00081411E8
MSRRHIALTTLVVRDYDEAIAWYRGKLGFHLLEDTVLSAEKRWVVMAPDAGAPGALLLARASGNGQSASIGNQAGGRVFLFLHTDDFWRDYRAMRDAGVTFREAPREEAYGTVAVFSDLYGNLWDLLQPNSQGT